MSATLIAEARPVSTDLAELTIPELLAESQRQSSRFVRGVEHSDAFTLELLRRAVAERSSDAWEALITQYGGIVRACIRRYRGFPATPTDETFWVYRTFERLWLAIRPERLHLIPSTAALVAYLKTCAHSVVMDEARERLDGRRLPLDLAPPAALEAPDVTDQVVEQMTASDLWRAVCEELNDDLERDVAHGSFIRGAKPSEIYAAHPELYADVADVYRIKRNLLERLRRSPRLRDFRGQ
jgi:DNA-directed RNA polymerase specialized sigma24 family protein